MADEAKHALAMRDVVKDPSRLREHRKELDTLRLEDNRDWALNREFYLGNQWVFWNRVGSRIETLGLDEGEKPRYKVRLTLNQTTPATQQLVAQMTKTRPVLRAIPDSGGDRDIKAAEFAERLYEYLWDDLGLSSKLNSALTHAQISQGYWLIDFDPLAGKAMKFMLDPNSGAPITDEMLGDVYREELRAVEQQFQIPSGTLLSEFEKTVFVGDIRVQVLDGPNVWLDPAHSNYEDARYAICRFSLAVDEIEARWGKKITPDASTADRRPSLMATRTTDDRPKNVRDVFFLYHRPGPTMPRGKYVVWIEGPNEILASSDWPYPFTKLPLVKFPGIERPGSIYDEPRGTISRPLQKELNNKVSKAAMHINLTMKPQMMAPIGSLRQRLTDEPGAVFEYAPIQGMQPEWRPIPPIPPQILDWVREMQNRIDRVYNALPTERTQLPARTDSGMLVELMQEAVADQLSPEIMRMERSLALAGDLIAALAQKYYEEPRMLKIKGPGGSVQVKKFMNTDLLGGFSFSAEAGSGLPRTRAGQMAQIRELIEMQVISPQEALPYLPVSGLKTIQSRLAADEDFAHRKIEKLIKGEPLNVPALHMALAAVETGMNPETEQMFLSPEDAMTYVESAALSPLPFENLAASMFIVGQHMKAVEFERYPPEIQQRFYMHYSQLQDAANTGPQTQEPVKTTLSLKGTVGPTVAAEILQRGGIQGATPQTMAEPPLETSVYDSVDKPDADEAGNDPLESWERAMAMQQSAEQHAQKMTRSQQLADDDDADREIKRSREEEVHQARLRNMDRPPAQKAA
jgi:hypothetical protein